MELSEASGCRLESILSGDHPLLPEAGYLRDMGLDPAGAIASGALLLTVQGIMRREPAGTRTGGDCRAVLGRVPGRARAWRPCGVARWPARARRDRPVFRIDRIENTSIENIVLPVVPNRGINSPCCLFAVQTRKFEFVSSEIH